MARVAQQRKAALDVLMRDSIYEAAVKVLREFGLDGLTMDRVAKEAEVAKGTLYNYYHDKDGLVRHVHDRILEPLFEAMERIRASQRSSGDKLKEIIREAMVFFETNRVTLRLLDTPSNRAQKRKGQQTRGIELIEAVLVEGIDKGEFRHLNARHVAELILGALVGFFESLVERDQVLNMDRDLEEIVGFFIHGLSDND
jgi:AcrR family transcriptional regulator